MVSDQLLQRGLIRGRGLGQRLGRTILAQQVDQLTTRHGASHVLLPIGM